MKPPSPFSPRLRAALTSVLISVPIGALLLGVAVLLGWEDLDGPADAGELGVGIALAILTGVLGAALQQAASRDELGPEVLLGPLVWYVELLIVGGVFTDATDVGKTFFGCLMVLGAVAQLTFVAARLVWVRKSP